MPDAALSDLALIERQARTLYRLDSVGRLLCVNEPPWRPAPRLFIGRTRDGDCWLPRHDLAPPLVATLARHLAAEPVATEFAALPACFAALVAALAAAGPAPTLWHGPALMFPPVADPPAAPPAGLELVTVTPRRASLLAAHFSDLVPELLWRTPVLALVDANRAVAVCFSARTTAFAAEAGVETAPPFRSRGFAPWVTAAWARAVRAGGRTPLYSASWDNHASRAVARKLGLRRYGADLALW